MIDISIWKALYDTPYTDEIALTLGDSSVSYSELKAKVMLFSDKLRAVGIKKGDVVTIALPNIIESIVAFYGVNACGGIANMVHPSLPNFTLRTIQENTHSKLLIGLSNHLSIGLKITCNADKTDVTGWDNFMRTPSSPISYTETNGICAYLHSGGTTDKPKTIVLSSKNLNALARDLKKIFKKDECVGYKSLTTLPLFHAFGLGAGIHALLLLGANLVLVPKFDRLTTPNLIVENKINMMLGVPLIYQSILNNKCVNNAGDLSHIKYCFVGGDFVPDELVNGINKLFLDKSSTCKLCVGYGLTECVSVVTVNTPKDYKLGSIGKPLGSIRVGVLKDNAFMPYGEIGELCISSDTVMVRYLTGRNKCFFEHDGKRWLKTGDYGYIDADGYCHFADRKKRIAKINGVTVFPSEVENLLSSYHGILSSYVKLGKNRKLVAYVVKSNDVEITEEDVKDYLKSHTMKWAIPEKVVFLDSMPLSPIGKIDINSEIFNQ